MKELLGPKVENVGLAIVQEKNNLGEKAYYVYLINLKKTLWRGLLSVAKAMEKTLILANP